VTTEWCRRGPNRCDNGCSHVAQLDIVCDCDMTLFHLSSSSSSSFLCCRRCLMPLWSDVDFFVLSSTFHHKWTDLLQVRCILGRSSTYVKLPVQAYLTSFLQLSPLPIPTICTQNSFYRAMLYVAWAMLSQDVCMSVCPYVTRGYCVETAKHIKLFHNWVATPF